MSDQTGVPLWPCGLSTTGDPWRCTSRLPGPILATTARPCTGLSGNDAAWTVLQSSSGREDHANNTRQYLGGNSHLEGPRTPKVSRGEKSCAYYREKRLGAEAEWLPTSPLLRCPPMGVNVSNLDTRVSPRASGVTRRNARNGRRCPRCQRPGIFAVNSIVCRRCADTRPSLVTVAVTITLSEAGSEC